MPITILPKEESGLEKFATSIGSGLGSGFGRGIEALAQHNLEEMISRKQSAQAAKQLEQFFPKDVAQALSQLPPQFQQAAFKSILQAPTPTLWENLWGGASKVPDVLKNGFGSSQGQQQVASRQGNQGNQQYTPEQLEEAGYKNPGFAERTGVRSLYDLAHAGTVPGDIYSTLRGLASSANTGLSDLLEYVTGHRIPEAPNAKKGTLLEKVPELEDILPTSKGLKEYAQNLAEQRYGPGTDILQPRNFLEDTISRTAQYAISAAVTGGSTGLLGALGSGIGGAALKSAGAPPGAQAVGEIVGGFLPALTRAPALLKRVLGESKLQQANAFEAGKKAGMHISVDKEKVAQSLSPIYEKIDKNRSAYSKPIIEYFDNLLNTLKDRNSKLTATDLWNFKQDTNGLFKGSVNDTKVATELYKKLNEAVKTAGSGNKKFLKLYDKSAGLTKGIKNADQAYALLGLTPTNEGYSRYIIPGLSLATMLRQVASGKPANAIKTALIAGAAHGLWKKVVNPARAAQILYNASPEIKQITQALARAEVRKNPDVAARLVQQLSKSIGENLNSQSTNNQQEAK
jgi:hypothetical protein